MTSPLQPNTRVATQRLYESASDRNQFRQPFTRCIVSAETLKRMEYITIVGISFDEVVAECQALKLVEQSYSLMHPIDRHQLRTTKVTPETVRHDRPVIAIYGRRSPATSPI
jgi:hypothetical protein